MSKISNQVQQGDITRWGIAAMVFGGLAVLSASLSGNFPDNLAIGLHATHIQGGNINLLREQVAYLIDQQNQLERGNDQLSSQVRLNERDQGELVRRLSALETAIPALLEEVPRGIEVDSSIATGSVGEEDGVETYDVNGGTVSVTQRPLFATSPEPDAIEVPEIVPSLPPVLETHLPAEPDEPMPTSEAVLTSTQYGLAIGEIITEDTAVPVWSALQNSIGTLLIGLEPALSGPAGTGDSRIIVGPIDDYAQAEGLCSRIARAGVPCLPVQYAEDNLLELSLLAPSN